MQKNRIAKYVFVQCLTFGRIPLILVCLGVSVCTDTGASVGWFSVAFGAMVLAALTDGVDGYFARRFDVQSRLGAYADPLTDKVFYLTAFPLLVFLAGLRCVETAGSPWSGCGFHARLLLVLTVLFLLRDQWVSFLRALGAIHNVDGRANWSGKLRTLISFPVVCAVYYYLQAPRDTFFDVIPIYRWPLLIYMAEIAALVINIVSIWIYTVYYWPVLRAEFVTSRDPKGTG